MPAKKASQINAPISARWALTDQELDFCRIYAGFGYENAAEAFRRSFYPRLRNVDTGGYYDDPELEKLSPAAVSKRASGLLGQSYIKKFLQELKGSGSDRAREILLEQAQFGDDATQRRAAEKILEQEDKLGFRDAVEQYAQIMCAIGAEVVVPAPGGGEVVIPFKEMFPRYKEAMPPVEVLEKTKRCLEDYIAKLLAPPEEEGK